MSPRTCSFLRSGTLTFSTKSPLHAAYRSRPVTNYPLVTLGLDKSLLLHLMDPETSKEAEMHWEKEDYEEWFGVVKNKVFDGNL